MAPNEFKTNYIWLAAALKLCGANLERIERDYVDTAGESCLFVFTAYPPKQYNDTRDDFTSVNDFLTFENEYWQNEVCLSVPTIEQAIKELKTRVRATMRHDPRKYDKVTKVARV